MTTEYISRETAIETVKFYEAECDPIPRAIDSMEQIPAADVRPVVRAHWISENDFLMDVVNRCSACGEEFVLIDGTPADNNYNFCPNCGADMGKVSENG